MGIDPGFVELYLDNYYEFRESKDVESGYILWDLSAALWNAPLTSAERSVIQKLYLTPPVAPFRRAGPGRPSGGTTQNSLGEKSTISNLKKSAIQKIADYLGKEYGVDG